MVSRIDLAANFTSACIMDSSHRSAWVTRAVEIHSYAKDPQFTGWTVGMGGGVAAWLYDKTKEIMHSGKVWAQDLWLPAGWQPGPQVWRLEFELKRDCLKEMSLSSLDSVLSNLNGLWRYATTEWLRLTAPNVVDATLGLTHEEANRLIRHCAPHLAALVRFALATGCRASEITGLEWNRVDLSRHTAWLNQTKNGTPRGVPLNEDAVEVLEAEIGKNLTHCFTFQGEPIGWQISNTAWHTALKVSGIENFRFHDLRHTWASWHRQAGTWMTCHV